VLEAAERLRSRRIPEQGSGLPGLISAWPLAGRGPRALAGFIDLTLGVVAATAVVVGGSVGLLPEVSRYWYVVLAAFGIAQLVNACLLEAFGGSVGKRLVVLTLRTREGALAEPWRVILRGVLKWLLFPGWVVILFDPGQRALHDLVCGTLVLKGRARGGF
jgi:uncharacterized RDD family membrane protein YckC